MLEIPIFIAGFILVRFSWKKYDETEIVEKKEFYFQLGNLGFWITALGVIMLFIK